MEKKNTILLTVIAIATLLVAMVGATFAYFTAQRGEGAQAEINVKTSTSDSLEMGTFTKINIVANQDNFGKDKGTRSGTSEGEISLTANDAETTKEVEYCYTADFYVESNDFEYSRPDDVAKASSGEMENDPELVLTIEKTPASTIVDNGEGTPHNYTETLKEKTEDEVLESGVTLTYYDKFFTSHVCDNDNSIVAGQDPESCPEESISGYDITKLEAGKTISIPDTASSDNLVHKIKAPKNTKVTDKWKARVYFVNYDYDQEKNTGHTFTGQLKFTSVNCDTGKPDLAEP